MKRIKLSIRVAVLLGIAGITPVRSQQVANKPSLYSAYHIPGEYTRHARTWMQWPVGDSSYHQPGQLQKVRVNMALLARTIADFEEVVMLTGSAELENARRLCGPGVKIMPLALSGRRIRDISPAFAKDDSGGMTIVDMHAHAGGDAQVVAGDSLLSQCLGKQLGIPVVSAGFAAAGGALEGDGSGTLIASEYLLIPGEAGKGVSKPMLERQLSATLGVRKVIWMKGRQELRMTAAPANGFIRFVRPGVVLAERYPGWDEGYHSAEAKVIRGAIEVLQHTKDASGQALEVKVIEVPQKVRSASAGFVRSYAGYYVCNGAVIMPCMAIRLRMIRRGR
ncbi:hypothetical protein CK934_19580 [Chitinophaga sp. MD30]|nr:agmatine deiminase family protein [Chitinophaga sp. MD30]ASZ13003.1 hypothetical protein CK934_19580 [Chitinophaga sp. MD30]